MIQQRVMRGTAIQIFFRDAPEKLLSLPHYLIFFHENLTESIVVVVFQNRSSMFRKKNHKNWPCLTRIKRTSLK